MGNVSADGKLLWLSGRFDNVVYAINTSTGEVRSVPVGRQPHGLTVWPQPGRYSLGHTGNMRHERSTSDAPPTFGAACGYSRDIRRSLAGILPFDTTRRHNQMLVCRVEPFKSKQINGRRVRYSFISWCVTSQFHATISSCVARECGGRGAGFRRSCMSEKFDP